MLQRLRKGVDTNEPPDKTDRLMYEAADEIARLSCEINCLKENLRDTNGELDRLRAKVKRFRMALDSIAAICTVQRNTPVADLEE